ncbi:ABC transporter permease, partial [Calditrichota bacterium]
LFNTFIRLDAGHVKIIPNAAVGRSRPLPLDEGIKNLNEIMQIVLGTDHVSAAAPRIKFPVLLDKGDGGIPAAGIGVLPSAEKDFIRLQELLISGRMPVDDEYAVLLGSKLADQLGLTTGDEMFFVTTDSYGGLGPGLYKVSGITETGVVGIDRRTFYITMPAAQEQLALDNSAAEIVVLAEGGLEQATEVAKAINERLQMAGRTDVTALSWKEQGTLYRAMAPARFYILILMALLAVVAMTTVVNTILMSVMERTREIGALRAMGFERKTVTKLIVSETLVIGLLGTIFGMILGLAIALILQRTGIDLSAALDQVDMPINSIIRPQPRVITAVKSGIFGVLTSILAAWYPARVANRLEPADAIRMN